MAINDNAVLKGTGTYYTVVEDPTAQDAVLNLSDHHFDTSDDSDLEFEMAKKITGLMVEIGDFHYYPRTEYVDWTPVGHTDTVSLNTDEWKQVIRDLPEVLRELGAIK